MNKCRQCGNRVLAVSSDGLCHECTIQNRKDQERIIDLMGRGHPHHCACRQVWGDGECECDLYELGYDPYAWAKEPESTASELGYEPYGWD